MYEIYITMADILQNNVKYVFMLKYVKQNKLYFIANHLKRNYNLPKLIYHDLVKIYIYNTFLTPVHYSSNLYIFFFLNKLTG